jgi:hypothetical protein
MKQDYQQELKLHAISLSAYINEVFFFRIVSQFSEESLSRKVSTDHEWTCFSFLYNIIELFTVGANAWKCFADLPHVNLFDRTVFKPTKT